MTGNAPTVLIVEDEVLVRMMAVDVLASRNLQAIEAGTSADALEALATRPDIGLMIVDITIPGGMDGVGLAHAAAKQRPGLPILIVSGRQEVEAMNLPPKTRFMPKPFSATGLNWAVDDALRL